MAEEEILQETAAPPKKKEGGGFSFVHLIVIAVLLVIVTVVITMMIQSKVGKLGTDLSGEIQNFGTYVRGEDMTRDRVRMEPCQLIVPLAPKEDPMIVNLADGEHFLSVGISVCLSIDKKEAKNSAKLLEEFEAKKDMAIYACNEYLSTLTKATLFPASAAAQPKALEEEAEEDLGVEDLLGEENPSFSKKMDAVRGELLKMLSARDIRYIKDVYFTSFLIQ